MDDLGKFLLGEGIIANPYIRFFDGDMPAKPEDPDVGDILASGNFRFGGVCQYTIRDTGEFRYFRIYDGDDGPCAIQGTADEFKFPNPEEDYKWEKGFDLTLNFKINTGRVLLDLFSEQSTDAPPSECGAQKARS